ncbi:preprotein translocase, SecY subunit [Methylococcus capsulatus str. Bath]|jgi:preprotein translocase subunit SecY|uniref:Protein translocase subunit SecY n=1 Tax=Methylococcus capsulatus (strain ATCC 33009 / NCIMB 11132 / Bath) TaxID=243233 RepID=Q605D2_METCA|nr:preprotein translocase subunit SecY [Methylococcus capsulatus]AAU91489.1 preprotein translocase, SecY subunit [Methylococcus capsulatus str. Bath]
MNAINPLMADRGGRFTELRQRLLFVVGALIVFRIGAHIPIPGVDPKALAAMFNQQGSSILDMVNMFSGGALKRLSIFALGIMPYISASIILQLMTIVVPKLEQLKKEGESGRKKINQYTRYATVVLASFQATGVAMALQNQSAGGAPIVVSPGFQFVALTAISLVTGTMFLMWLGEQVTERGLGNGISIIIFAGIVAGLPSAVGGTLELARTGELGAFSIIGIAAIAVAVTWLVVFVEKGQRRITINYAKRQEGRRMYAAQKSFLPLKLNMSGVIPPIFASSIILFPATLAGWFGNSEKLIWLQDIASTLSPGQPLYVLCYAAAIMFFCFFYAALVFNSNETAENLKKSGAFIPGIRPGQQTARYVDTVMTRLTLIGGIYITAVCLLPEFLIVYWNVPFYFGGTSLLIIVVVVMDFMAQIQTYVISQQYEGLLKKTNINIR